MALKGVPTMKKTGVLAAAIGICTPFTAATLIAAASPHADLPAAKQALVDAAKVHRAAGRPAIKATDLGRPLVAQTDEQPATGFLGQVAAPISGEEFTAENAWAGWLDADTYVQVYAGSSPSRPEQGLVFVVRRHGRPDGRGGGLATRGRLIAKPGLGGPASIVRIEGRRVVVRDPHGHEARFDPGTETFD
jgi:hypothetical protein